MLLHDREAILARVDLELLADELLGARRGGGRLWSCPNPDHAQTGRTPPLSVFRTRHGTQRWRCHGCGDAGTAIDLVIAAGRAGGVGEALAWLAAWSHTPPGPLPPARPPGQRTRPRSDPLGPVALEAYALGCRAYLGSGEARWVRAWLTGRRAIPPEIVAAAGLGADPGPRRLPRPDGVPKVFPAVVFPVREADRVIFTLSRHLRPVVSRWWNAADHIAPNPRLAFYEPPRRLSRELVVTEGPLDALSALTAGYRAAALLGATAGGDRNVADRLAGQGARILLALDNDRQGQTAQARLGGLLDERGVEWRRLGIPEQFPDLNAWHSVSGQRWPAVMRAANRLTCRQAIRSGPPCVA
ncbi:MAG TPA: toprim domain-containing protein [Acidimicrobiales bacterium]|nr:toprim domain-containing protein [Acidimicrobiales bacterium]